MLRGPLRATVAENACVLLHRYDSRSAGLAGVAVKPNRIPVRWLNQEDSGQPHDLVRQRTGSTAPPPPRLVLHPVLRGTSLQGTTANARCQIRHCLGAGAMSLRVPVRPRDEAMQRHPTSIHWTMRQPQAGTELRRNLAWQKALASKPLSNSRQVGR